MVGDVWIQTSVDYCVINEIEAFGIICDY